MDRTEVMPTGGVVGKVVDVLDNKFSVLVKVEDWFVGSDVFKMGAWTGVAIEPTQKEGEVRMEVAGPA